MLRTLCCALLLGAPTYLAASEPPQAVTTDTVAYCHQLMGRLDRELGSDPPPAAVHTLAMQGHAMCARGEIRGGILRLRRALLILRNGGD